MSEHALTAIPIGFLMSFMIGPVFFVLLETSAIKGIRAATAFDGGVVFSDVIFIFIAYFTSYQLLQKLEEEPVLFIIGGLILTVYGIVSMIKAGKSQKRLEELALSPLIQIKNNYLSLFAKGFMLNFINIGVLGFWLGLIVVFVPKWNMTPNEVIYFFSLIIASYFFVDLIKIVLAKQLQAKLTTKRIFALKKFIGILLIVFGLLMMSQAFFPHEKNKIQKVLDRVERK